MYDNVHLGKIHDAHGQVAFMLSYTNPAEDPAAALSGGLGAKHRYPTPQARRD